MIAVIADDFTGAAEIGGIGLRYQMKVEINTAVNFNSTAGLLVIATDNRSKTEREAVAEINEITTQLNRLSPKPKWIYKKIDSVLRGHVIAELSAQMKHLEKRRALIVPANPHFGRIIKDGIYYVNEEKLHHISFTNDPGLATASSHVLDILENKNNINLIVAKPETLLPENGIVIGEASTVDDLYLWAKKVHDNMLLAGASGFFSALLEKEGLTPQKSFKKPAFVSNKKTLIVCGSPFITSKKMIRKALAEEIPVSLMPVELTISYEDQSNLFHEQWASKIVSLFTFHHIVVVSINPSLEYKKELPGILRKNMALAVTKAIQQLQVEELMLEGGSTAAAILKELGFERFYPQQELASGVIRMSIPENKLHITLKPGSYEWPAFLWNKNHV